MGEKKIRFISIFLVLIVIAVFGCVENSEVVMVKRDLNTRMDLLENRVDQLEREDAAGTKGEIENLRVRQVEMFNAIEEIRTTTQDLTGTLESRVLKMQRDMRGKKTGETAGSEELSYLREEIYKMQQRLDALERSASKPAGTVPKDTRVVTKPASEPKAESKTEPKAEPKISSEDSLYKDALQAYREGEFEAAQVKFEDFLSKYPQSGNADNAQFWIGESLFKRKEYGKAILEYQKVIEKYNKGNKVPDAILKQALAFKALGDSTSARILLEKLMKQYTQSPQAEIAKKELQRL